MKRVILKVFLSIVILSVIVVAVFGSLITFNNRKAFEETAEITMLNAVEKNDSAFDLILQRQELTVDALAAVASEVFVVEEYLGRPEVFAEQKARCDGYMRSILLAEKGVLGLYLTFDPESSGGKNEIWYIGDGEQAVRLDDTADSTDWLNPENEVTFYYYRAIEQGSHWSDVYQDRLMNGDYISYSRAVYDRNSQLVGVAGTDIPVGDIQGMVSEMKVSPGDYAVLLGQDYQYIAGDGAEGMMGLLEEDGLLTRLAGAGTSSDVFRFSLQEQEYFVAYARLSNGWILVLMQPEVMVMHSFNQVWSIILLLSLLSILTIILYSLFCSKRFVLPALKEAEQQEIILVNQSRQAKLGEMVGNVAHQCKQPLNGLNIHMSNLEDDFYSGELSAEAFNEHLRRMRLGVRTMSDTVDVFSNFLKPSRGREFFNGAAEVQVAQELMRENLKVHSISVEIIREGDDTIYGLRNGFLQALFNVLDNARDAIIESNPPLRLITVKLWRKSALNGEERLVVDVINKGRPIPVERLPLLFQPYFTTKEREGGLGIGLYLTKQIVEEHMGGTIEFINGDGQVCCRITLPVGEEGGNGDGTL